MMYPKAIRLACIFSATFFITCSEEEQASRAYPSVDTQAVTLIQEDGATFNAEILSIGTAGISDHGFVYGDASGPRLGTSETISLGAIKSTGAYSAFANRSLTKDKTYYVQAYAITKDTQVVVYGQEVQFKSLGGSPPEFHDFFPKHGVTGDTITVVGSGFSNVAANNTVTFGGKSKLAFKATSDTIWCIVPPTVSPGENAIEVKTGQITLNLDTKFVVDALTLTGATPAAVTFGDTITVTGVNFPLVLTEIYPTVFQRRPVVVSTSRTQIKIIVTKDAVGPDSPVTVFTGSQTVSTTGKVSLLKPILTDFAPTSGSKGTQIIIHGDYFNPIPVNNKVELNGIPLVVVECSKTTLKVNIPSNVTIAPGKYSISLTVANQLVVSTDQFEII